ncbi:hypothetical protein ACHAXT_001148 [Thalassiosira profunda]
MASSSCAIIRRLRAAVPPTTSLMLSSAGSAAVAPFLSASVASRSQGAHQVHRPMHQAANARGWGCKSATFSSAAAHVDLSEGDDSGEDSSDQQGDQLVDSIENGTNTSSEDGGLEGSADSATESFEGIPPEEVIRTGKCTWVSYEKQYAKFEQDEKYPAIDTGASIQRTVYIPFQDIYPEIGRDLQSFGAHKLVRPKLHGRQDHRTFQFQARAPDVDGKDLRGFNLRFEGGGDIRLIHEWRDALTVMSKARAKLGHEVYEILSSAAGRDEGDIAKEVTEAIERCDRRTKWARGQIGNPRRVERECKALLGTEVYELLSNIATEYNIEQRVDDAYMRCLKDLSALELAVGVGAENEEEAKEEKHAS